MISYNHDNIMMQCPRPKHKTCFFNLYYTQFILIIFEQAANLTPPDISVTV